MGLRIVTRGVKFTACIKSSCVLVYVQGPFVMIEDFIRLTLECQIPDLPPSGL